MVPDGRGAIRAVQKTRFDLVFMDVQMPVVDGITATRSIRAAGHASVFICAVTVRERRVRRRVCSPPQSQANVMQTDREACADAGMDDFLGKPLDIAELERVLRFVASGAATAGRTSAATPAAPA